MAEQDTGIINITLQDVREVYNSKTVMSYEFNTLYACLCGQISKDSQGVQFIVAEYRRKIKEREEIAESKRLEKLNKITIMDKIKLIFWRLTNG